MNIFQELILQIILFGAILGSFAGVFVLAVLKGIVRLFKFLIKKYKESK